MLSLLHTKRTALLFSTWMCGGCGREGRGAQAARDQDMIKSERSPPVSDTSRDVLALERALEGGKSPCGTP